MNSKSEIVPLVSFPKSGNTWVRFLLANLFKKDEDFKIDFISAWATTGKLLAYNKNNTKKNPIVPMNIPISIKVGENIVHDEGR